MDRLKIDAECTKCWKTVRVHFDQKLANGVGDMYSGECEHCMVTMSVYIR